MNKLSSDDIFEIKQSYRLAKDKDAQIDILSDLYLVDRQTIKQIVQDKQIVQEEACKIDDSNLVCPIKDILGPKGNIRQAKMAEVVDWVRTVAPTHSVKDIASALGVSLRSVYQLSSKNGISWRSKNKLSDCEPDVDDTCEYPMKCHEISNTSKSKIGPGALSNYVQEDCTEAVSIDSSVPKELCADAIRLCSKDTFTSSDWFKLGTILSRLERLL